MSLGADVSFACWFWDYDNDGRLDLFVNETRPASPRRRRSPWACRSRSRDGPGSTATSAPTASATSAGRSASTGPWPPMGCNFGDIDNDGYLDLYLGTGWMSYSGLVPNLMFKNVEGRRFEDVTESSGTGHLQKGHGVSFADWDGDGDLDLFVESGRGGPRRQVVQRPVPEPRPRPPLAEGQAGRHQDQPRGARGQDPGRAQGSRRRATVDLSDDRQQRQLRRQYLVELIGLLDATVASTELTVTWPTSHTTQIFRDVAADQAIEITEGSDSFKVLHQPPISLPPVTR